MFNGFIEGFAKELIEKLSPELRVMTYDWLIAMEAKAEETDTWVDNIFVYFVKRVMGFDNKTTTEQLKMEINNLRSVLKK